MGDLQERFNQTYNEVMALDSHPQAGLHYWQKKKQTLDTTPLENWKWTKVDDNFDPHNSNGEFHIDPAWTISIATPLHFTNQVKRIPIINVPSERKVMQMALNIAQAVRSGLKEYEKYQFCDVVIPKS